MAGDVDDSDMAGDVDDRSFVFLQSIIHHRFDGRNTGGVWLARLMEELIEREGDPPMLYVDNKATISQIKNLVLHDQSKHIEIRSHYIRKCADRWLIKIDFIRIEENLETFPPSLLSG